MKLNVVRIECIRLEMKNEISENLKFRIEKQSFYKLTACKTLKIDV